jgi:hypothetical protein
LQFSSLCGNITLVKRVLLQMNRIFIGIVAFILLMITVVAILSSGGSKPKTPTGVVLKPLPDYANTDATVSMETQGRVVGDENYRAIVITIGRDERDLQVIQGYSGNVIQSKTFYNTQAAYDVFLRSINGGGFTAKLKATKYTADERGVCPLGNRSIYTLSQNNEDLSRLWGTTCGPKVGTFAGSQSLMQQLFRAQIPDYSKLVQNVQL